MIVLTKALKAHAVKHFGVKPDAKDREFLRVVGAKVAGGQLAPAKLAELTKGAKPPAKKRRDEPPPADDRDRPHRKGIGTRRLNDLVEAQVKKALANAQLPPRHGPAGEIEPTELFSKAVRVRVKGAAEQYATTTKAAVYPERCRKDGQGSRNPFAGQPASVAGRSLDHPSDLAKAVSAAWVKWCLDSQTKGQGVPSFLRLTDHDRDLVYHAMHKMEWTGFVKGRQEAAVPLRRKKLAEMHVKALLDDTVSGGIEVAPAVFDEAIILFPVLYGELFPFVTVQNVARGRRVKGASMQNPTFTSGTAEGTAITPFNTATFVGAFDTPIFTTTGAMEIGLDFEEDSQVDLGSVIVEKYGEKALEWLDRVIAVGNGFDEPLGMFNTTGIVAVQSDNGVGGNPTVSDYEGLLFGIGKAFRSEAGAVIAFVASDTTYRRSRSIPVGSNDERRVFGMTHEDYSLLNHGYKVQNDIPNSKIACANLKRYRMYRRLGLSVRMETGGRALALANTKLLVLRMRYGGQMETALAMSAITDAQQ
jgi:HK97 family phage major capsid protein